MVDSDHCPRMRRAIKCDDVIAVQKLLSMGVDIDLPLDTVTGNTPLILATCYGAARVLPLVLDVGAEVDVCNREGRSALDKAVLSYALAHNLCLHKMAEMQRRYFILRLLVAAGCSRISPKELELCVLMNEHDEVFLHKLVNVIKSGPSQRLKTIALSVLIHIDVHYSYIKSLLVGGATFDDFLHSFRSSSWRTRRPLGKDLVHTVIRATSDVNMLRLMSDHYSCVMQSPRTPMPTSVAALLYLAGHHERTLAPRPSRVSGSAWRGLMAEVPPNAPPTLRHLCRTCIRTRCRVNMYHATLQLPLPAAIRHYLTLETHL